MGDAALGFLPFPDVTQGELLMNDPISACSRR